VESSHKIQYSRLQDQDYGKFKIRREEEKRAEARKKQRKVVEIKEIKMRR